MAGYASVKLPKPGPNALELVRAAVRDGQVRTEDPKQVTAACKANGNGYLERDPKDGKLWFPTDRAREMLAMLDALAAADEGPASPQARTDVVAASVADTSGLVETVQRARALFDEGDIMNARIVAGVAYAQAKTAAYFAEQIGATERLVTKAREMQAEALRIESWAKILIADKWDEAEAAGQTFKGRPKSVPNENAFTAEQAGLSRKEIHDARKLALAEKTSPGLVERFIQARLTEGLEPTRASLRKATGAAIGTKSATKEEKGDQLYETPAEATRTLLALEAFSSTFKEPAVGRGAILRVMEDAGYDAVIADLRDRGTATQYGEAQQVGDFLTSEPGDTVGMDIVTNPPYGDVANAFLAHALQVHRPRKMAALLNLNFQCGFDDPDRRFLMDENPPSRVYVFTRRLPMMHRDGWTGPQASSQMNTMWVVWERNDDGSYGSGDGSWKTIRVDWEKYQTVPALVPGDGNHAAPMIFADVDPEEDFTRETPRRSLDERVGDEWERAEEWVRQRPDGFARFEMRQALGLRTSTVDALISGMLERGIVSPGDGELLALADLPPATAGMMSGDAAGYLPDVTVGGGAA
ncbi:SAM-dependent methyltransferase [Rhizobium sp. S95]|uniref:SAM-dependent methyltransferase n=1 Tax=Ciceribacter sichuanensis TaxID=2949647 RepID=A0AAJ1BWM6_9HYPH|nr:MULTISPECIES: SAM-dependent methyltransferase [unclassified Ciceribacter]MCM2396208.1 SAM-dependent methyltransferase [Ciceribacter sp. S95]MCO5957641.1 SAM-dependent methyltransferase [Ciceribacter sp. S101]